jgi:hypothetical protein
MVEYSITCLANMAVDEASIEELIDEGAIESLMEVMRLHPNNEKLMQMFNKLVAKMCINERLADLIGAKMGRNFEYVPSSTSYTFSSLCV